MIQFIEVKTIQLKSLFDVKITGPKGFKLIQVSYFIRK